ncbi:related to UMP1 - proteasome maturation factor [Pseudozyma flocculosa]|uniref:Related to UMP1 - proteasome maturation factor n=1 Tax=Pseudozyma flocculosa TaxID=84751 RepID=A0A5C3FEP6_9BASI|nr:related to UMP1 - proteasome maturation factor [Pseudozyma flocculosa]
MSTTTQTPAPSLAVVPPPRAANGVLSTHATSHREHLGVHDALRFGPQNLHHTTSLSTAHPAQNRLEKWDETRDNLNLTMQRNLFGLGAPVRTLMERRIVSHNPHFPTQGMSNLHLDILNGKDETLEPVDFLPSEVASEQLDIHSHMERKYRI